MPTLPAATLLSWIALESTILISLAVAPLRNCAASPRTTGSGDRSWGPLGHPLAPRPQRRLRRRWRLPAASVRRAPPVPFHCQAREQLTSRIVGGEGGRAGATGQRQRRAKGADLGPGPPVKPRHSFAWRGRFAHARGSSQMGWLLVAREDCTGSISSLVLTRPVRTRVTLHQSSTAWLDMIALAST